MKNIIIFLFLMINTCFIHKSEVQKYSTKNEFGLIDSIILDIGSSYGFYYGALKLQDSSVIFYKTKIDSFCYMNNEISFFIKIKNFSRNNIWYHEIDYNDDVIQDSIPLIYRHKLFFLGKFENSDLKLQRISDLYDSKSDVFIFQNYKKK